MNKNQVRLNRQVSIPPNERGHVIHTCQGNNACYGAGGINITTVLPLCLQTPGRIAAVSSGGRDPVLVVWDVCPTGIWIPISCLEPVKAK